jgi:hypothetical protein
MRPVAGRPRQGTRFIGMRMIMLPLFIHRADFSLRGTVVCVRLLAEIACSGAGKSAAHAGRRLTPA